MRGQSEPGEPERAPRDLEVWGPLGRWIFVNWPRGSWQYDVICALVILLLLLLPGV